MVAVVPLEEQICKILMEELIFQNKLYHFYGVETKQLCLYINKNYRQRNCQ